jgi:NRPS condensation-like uncharacterized protein
MSAVPAELVDVALFGATSRYGDLCIHAVVDLRRSFGRAALERAFADAIAAFPILGRRYETRLWRDAWTPVAGPVGDAVHVLDPPDVEAETLAWVRRPIDVARERPLRVLSLARGAGSRLIVSILHTAVDGAGAAAVAHVLGASLYGVTPSAPTDARRSLRHALDGLRAHHAPALVRDAAIAAQEPRRLLSAGHRARAYEVASDSDASFRHLVIPADELARLRARTGVTGASVNDLLVAGLARVAASRSNEGPALVLYTMDLRRYGAAARLRAANNSTVLPALVPREATTDLASAAAAVMAITAGHRGSLLGPGFMLATMALALAMPHAIVRRLMPAFGAYAVDQPLRRGLLVTNVGRLDDGLAAFGDDVEDVRIIGPNIRGVPIPAVVAFGYRGALHLELFAAPGLAEGSLTELEDELFAALDLPTRREAARALAAARSVPSAPPPAVG